MKHLLGAALCGFAILSCLKAQENFTDNITGTNIQLQSKVLGEDRNIQIYLPQDYKTSDQSYPVLYVLDGQRFFLYAVSLSQTFRQFEFTPDFIIVGITNQYPQRFGLYSEKKSQFLEFLEKELIPYLDSNYRTGNENMLFGWEFGAGFAFHTLLTKPSLFEGYFLASPYPIIDQLSGLESVSSLNKMLCYGVSPDEYEINISLNKLDSILNARKIDGLEWHSLKLPHDEHRSTGYPVLYHGLRNYFQYYPTLEVNNVQQFMDKGGMEYAKKYIEEREQRYGFPAEMSVWTRFTIIRSAIRADHFEHFTTLMDAMDQGNFIQELIDEGRSYGAIDIASFYERYAHPQKAIEVYETLLKNHPESEKLLTAMVNAQVAAGNHDKAEIFLNRIRLLQEKGN
jgi:predicted alpha/beta superfamily hydrolase